MEERIKEATEMFGGLEFINISEPKDFEKHVIKQNRIGTYINFDSICDMEDGHAKKIKKLQTMVRDGANDILGRSISIEELEKVMDAVDKAVLYSEITDFDGLKYMHTVFTNVKNEENELIVKSVPLENSEVVYRITLICGNKSVIISMDEIPISYKYQIAYDIYKGCSKPVKYSYSDALPNDANETLRNVDRARTGDISLRDIFQVKDTVFIPFDIINVGIQVEGKKRVLPYVVGALFIGNSNNVHGFAIKATEGSLVPTFLEKRYGLSLYNNEELFLELMKKYDDDNVESILMNSIRTYADAKMRFVNSKSREIMYKAYKSFEFHDDRQYYEAKDLIKLA
jgi:hypothetical protein